MRNTVYILLLSSVLLGCNPGSHYGVGTSVATGGAYLPVEYSGGATTSFHYHETGGLISRGILSLLAIMSAAPRTRTTVEVDRQTSSHGGYTRTTTTTTTTTTVLDSPEEIQRKAANAARMLESLRTSEIPFQFDFEIATSSLGGDTEGHMWSFRYVSDPITAPSMVANWSLGVGGGEYRFANREHTVLQRQGQVLQPVDRKIPSVHYSYLGMPIRIDVAFPYGITAHAQADLNLYSVDYLFDDDEIESSPIHFGMGYRASIVTILGDLAIERWRGDGLTAKIEVSIGL